MEEERIDDGADLRGAISTLATELGTLVRQEAALARCELEEKAEQARGGAVRIGAGGAFALVGAFTLAIAAVLGLTLLLSRWMAQLPAACLSALVVGAALGVAGYLFLKQGGERLRPERLLPRRTLDSIKEDARWARRQV